MCQTPAAASAMNQTSVIGPKKRRNLCGAVRLNGKQGHQDHAVIGTTYGSNAGVTIFRPSIGGQHRQRRRDHRVAVEQRAADDAEQDHGSRRAAQRAVCHRHQRKRPAFAIVVGAQQDHDVFCRHYDQQRPDDQATGCRARPPRLPDCPRPTAAVTDFAHRIERAGADIAIDDADAAERQRPKSVRGARLRGSAAARQQSCEWRRDALPFIAISSRIECEGARARPLAGVDGGVAILS